MSRTVTPEDLVAIEALIVTDPRRALSDALAAIDAIDRSGDKPLAAAALTLAGRIHGLLDQQDDAILLLTEAAELHRELDDPAGFARALLGLGAADRRPADDGAVAERDGDRLWHVSRL